MSTSSVSSGSSASSSSSYSTGSSLTSLGTGTQLQITGLASGLDTNAIVTALMQADQQQVTDLTNQQTAVTAKNTELTSIQTALQTVATDAQALLNPALFQQTQTVSSTNSTLVGATATANNGAVEGGYQVGVTQLATSAQRTFSYSAPASGDSVTIDGQQMSLTAGESLSSFVSQVNTNSNLDVWATATDSGTVVLSNRATGDTGTNYIQVSSTNASLAEQTSLAQEGKNAQFTINGVAGSSASNTVTSAIPGVSLSLNGLTTTSGTVTVDVSTPSANTQSIQTAIQQFVTDYNSAIGTIQTQLSQEPSSSTPSQGTLQGDPELGDLLNTMRQAMYSSGSGLPSGLASMLDIGVSTGAASGSSAPSASSLSGDLTLNATTLAQTLASNPTGVQNMLASWANSFSTLVENQSGPGGTIDGRIQADDQQNTQLTTQITNLNNANTAKEQSLVAEFAQMESTLSQNQSTSSWLTSQISALPGY